MRENTLTAIGAVLDCADPVTLADFWQEAIGFDVRTGEGSPYVTLSASQLRRPLNHLTLQRVDEPKTAKNRLHLDLYARDVTAEIDRILALGATELSRLPEGATGEDLLYATLADPEGHEFCVIASPSSAKPSPSGH
jgi:hypothetical protein